MSNIIKTIIELSLFGTFMIVVVLAVKGIFASKISRKIILFMWLMVAIRLVIPMTIDSPLHIDSLFYQESQINLEQESLQNSYNNVVTGNNNNILSNANNNIPSKTVTPQNSENINVENNSSIFDIIINFVRSFNVFAYAFIIWLAGVVALSIRNILQYMYFKKRLIKGTVMQGNDMYVILLECRGLLNMTKNIKIIISKYVSMPITFGLIKPVIILPFSFVNRLPKQKIKYILLHELCHIKRKDVFLNFLWLVAKTIHWFNPVVWIAYKKYLEDVELSCDEMVIRYISGEESFEYSQSLLDVIRFARTPMNLPTAASLCKDQSQLRKRVENILKPNKKVKSFSFISLLVAVVMLIACFTTACQPTPENEVVQSKDNDIMEQKISEGQVENTVDNESNTLIKQNENGNERAEMMVVDTWQDDTIESKPYLSLSVDAQILMPDVANYKAYEIIPDAALSNDTIRKLIRTLTGDAELHDGDEISKGEIEARLVEINKAIYDLENDVDKGTYSSDDGWDYDYYKNYEIESYNEEIEILNGLMESATDGYQTTIDIDHVDFENTEQFEAKAFAGRSSVANIRLIESLYFSFDNPGGFTIGKSFIDESEKNINLSINDAAAIGNMLLSDAGLNMYDIESIGLGYQYIGKEGASQENSPQGYVIHYERIVNGMPVCSTTRYNVEESETDAYKKPFQDELLQVAVDDSGIAQLDWESCYELDEDSASVVEIMPIDDVMKNIIIQQMFNYHSYNEYALEAKCVINRIELVMGRVPMKDNPEMEWLVPVWNVYGIYQADYGEGYNTSDTDSSLELSINALDGTVN